MMYMDDCVKSLINVMEADASRLSRRTDYNVGAFSCTPATLAAAIKKRVPGFTYSCEPDFRQGIADSWPDEMVDEVARADWDWNPSYGLQETVDVMLKALS